MKKLMPSDNESYKVNTDYSNAIKGNFSNDVQSPTMPVPKKETGMTAGAGVLNAAHPVLKDNPKWDGASADNSNENVIPAENALAEENLEQILNEHKYTLEPNLRNTLEAKLNKTPTATSLPKLTR
jgi:hypothetical protein